MVCLAPLGIKCLSEATGPLEGKSSSPRGLQSYLPLSGPQFPLERDRVTALLLSRAPLIKMIVKLFSNSAAASQGRQFFPTERVQFLQRSAWNLSALQKRGPSVPL